MTDDTTSQDEADSADLEAARSRLFGPPGDAASDPGPESQDPLAGNYVPRGGTSPTTDDDGDRAFARELFDSGN